MIQLLLYLLQLIAITLFFILAVAFTAFSIKKKENKTKSIVYGLLAALFTIAALYSWSIDVFSAESVDRKDGEVAFESNFGFTPPKTVKEIKVKNFGRHDSDIHWMAFTYDPEVFNRIVAHDQPLETADSNTEKYNAIVKQLENGCAHCPNWLELPNAANPTIYFKSNFLDKTSSEYYLWADPEEKMVYLEVASFD